MLCDKHGVALSTLKGDVDLSTSQGRLLARAWEPSPPTKATSRVNGCGARISRERARPRANRVATIRLQGRWKDDHPERGGHHQGGRNAHSSW